MSSSVSHALRAALEADVECVERVELLFSKEADAKSFVDFVFKDALDFPAPIKAIPKATLVVGAGKLDRAKFADDLPKWIMTALQKLGLQEDRGASALFACQGTFKFQHDVGKNEKYVHVFPFVKQKEAVAGEEGEGDEDEEDGAHSAGKRDPESMCIEAELKTFAEMSAKRIRPWMSKKRCMQMLKLKLDAMEVAQNKLISRVALTEEEQYLFDHAVHLEDKIAVLRSEMLQLVDEAKLSKAERDEALQQVRARMAEVAQPTEAMKTRLAALEGNAASFVAYHHPFDSEQRMNQLWQRSHALKALVDKAGPKGRWSSALTPQEVQRLGDKEAWDEEVQELGARSRFWFETEEELQLRFKLAKQAACKIKPKKASSTTAAAPKPMAGAAPTSWATVGSKSSSSSGRSAGSGKQTAGSVKNAFAALSVSGGGGGDSSDDDD